MICLGRPAPKTIKVEVFGGRECFLRRSAVTALIAATLPLRDDTMILRYARCRYIALYLLIEGKFFNAHMLFTSVLSYILLY